MVEFWCEKMRREKNTKREEDDENRLRNEMDFEGLGFWGGKGFYDER